MSGEGSAVEEEPRRPDPEALLREAGGTGRGRLTLFLGPVAGCGKTYALLEAARERLAAGEDLVAGWIETHGRPETERLLRGLPSVPPLTFEHRGATLREMDLDGLLARRPRIALVDELAHTNLQGRHERRWQDVTELLDAGISVYAALNVQHLESLNDAVARITGIRVRETVPDAILERADEVRLVDVSAEVLQRRLEEGKIYLPETALRARERFFRTGNVQALRELALRTAAARVDRNLRDYMDAHRIEGPWPAAERVMVCVGPSPFSASLVRAARRLAEGLKAEWFALHVRTPDSERLGGAERSRLARNLRMAEELGAEVVSLTAPDVPEGILRAARERRVSTILLGKPEPRGLLDRLRGRLGTSIPDRVLRGSGDVDVYAIRGRGEPEAGEEERPAAAPPRPLRDHLLALAGTALVVGAAWPLRLRVGNVNVAMLLTLPILLAALRFGRGPALSAAAGATLAFNFLFVPPLFTLAVAEMAYLWSFGLLFLIALVVGGMAERLRREARFLRTLERETRLLYGAARTASASARPEEALPLLLERAASAIGRPSALLTPPPEGGGEGAGRPRLLLRAAASPEGPPPEDPLADPEEAAVATWAFDRGSPAGRGAPVLPRGGWLFLPAVASGRTLGVWACRTGETPLDPDERERADAWVSLASGVLERFRLGAELRRAELVSESERLQAALLGSVSHELRTPLTAVAGAASALAESGELFGPAERAELLASIREGASRMEGVIDNLLDSARLEGGRFRPKREACDAEERVGATVRSARRRFPDREIRVRVEPDLPPFRGDPVLVEHVLINFLDNGAKYAPEGSPLELSAAREGEGILFLVEDRGPGVPPEERERIFGRFFRGSGGRRAAGTGLGLWICRGFAEALGGGVAFEPRPGGGSRFLLRLPLARDGGEGKGGTGG